MRARILRALTFIFLFASFTPTFAQTGTVKSSVKIATATNGFTGTFIDGSKFGFATDVIGDLDNDGVDDLIVGANFAAGSSKGTTFVLFMNSDGYQIRAVDGAGNISALSDVVSASPDGNGLPGMPTAVGVEGDLTQPLLVIENASGAANLLYSFEVASDEAFAQIIIQVSGITEGAGIDRGGATAWQVNTALEADVTYYWRAWAFDGVFDGPRMVAASFVAGGSTPVVNPGDFDGDLAVGFGDFIMFVSGFGSRDGDPRYQAVLDIDSSGDIGFSDFIAFAGLFGTQYGLGKIAPITLPQDGDAQSLLDGRLPGVGKMFEVVVSLHRAPDADGYGFELWFDPASVAFVSAQSVGAFGGLLDQDADRIWFGGQVGVVKDANALTLARVSFRQLSEPGVNSGPFAGIADLVIGSPDGIIRRVTDQTELVALPSVTALNRNHPNPFNPETTLPYSVAEVGRVSLVVYNTLGQQVVTLLDDQQEPGFYRVTWDGRDDSDRLVASGIYMVRMVAPNFDSVQKVLLLK